MTLRAPYPYFGGKSRAAPLIWPRLGDVSSYVEPFFGSGAVMLARSSPPNTETINDRDALVANFWRALQNDPEAVADFADAPVNEADLHAKHTWIISQSEFRERMLTDPSYYDAKIAGWWCWGMSAYPFAGWCQHENVSKKTGLMSRSIPAIGSTRGVISPRILDQHGGVQAEMVKLAVRLRRVHVACGDWMRVMTPQAFGKGPTGIILDPPYFDGLSDGIYAHSDRNVSADVRKWAIEHGDDPNLRVVICGYENEHKMPESWEEVAWKAAGGFGGQRADGSNQNAERERIWFSPACLKVTDSLFADYTEDDDADNS